MPDGAVARAPAPVRTAIPPGSARLRHPAGALCLTHTGSGDAALPTEEFVRKLRSAEDLAQRLQKRDWQTRASRDWLEALIKEMFEYVRRTNRCARRLDALQKAVAEIEKVDELSRPP